MYFAECIRCEVVVESYDFINDFEVYYCKECKKILKETPSRHSKTEKQLKNHLNHGMSRSIGQSLRGIKNGRHWEDLVGYTVEELKRHIEKLFLSGMTWDNYCHRVWHIDHIIPKAAFYFTKPEHDDFKRCWELKNLQPLWAKDNIMKSNKLYKHFQPSLLLG